MTPIPQEMLEAARRKTCRRAAAAIVRCMAETDTSFATMARRIGRDEDTVRDWFYDFVDGKSGKDDFDRLSDMTLAMGAELMFEITPYREIATAEYAEPTAEAA